MQQKINAKELLLGVFFPRRCPVCDEIVEMGTYLCESCKKKVSYVFEPSCKKCGKPLENERYEYCMDCSRKKHFFIQGKAVFMYRKEMKGSMYRFKYSNKREYGDYYAKAAAERYGKWIKNRGIEVIIPIPMYGKKKRARGYNQAEVFAVKLGRELGVPVDTGLLYRVKNTVPQKELNDRQRKDNLKGAFKLKVNIVEYKKILLVDDIYTTGSTIDAAAECLIEKGAEKIFFLTICIGEGC